MDHLGDKIFEIIESSNQPLSVDQIVNECHQEKNKVEESLDTLLSIGIITVNLLGLWSLSTGDKDDLCQDAECYSGSLPNTYSYPQQVTSRTEPTNAQTDPKVPLESMSSNDTAPKESSYSASNAQNWRSQPNHEPKADPSHTRNPRVPHRKVSDTNGISSTPIIQEVTLSGEDDMCTVLEATTLKEPVQSLSDNAVVPRNVSHSVVPRQNSSQTTIAVGGASIETSGQVKIMQLSTVDPHKNVLEKVIQLLRGSSEMKPLDIAKVCIGKSASKRDINRYLHCLEKAKFVCVNYLNKANKSNPVWSASPKARDITEEKMIELASELSKSPSKSRSQLELVPSSPASSHQYPPSSGNSTPHITEHHHHYHKHEHRTVVQVGEKNVMHVNVPDIECDRERITEQEVEKEL